MDKKSSLQIIFFIFLVFIDQLSKYAIRQAGGFYICNESLAFGLNLKHNSLLIVFVLLALLIFTNSKFKGPSPRLVRLGRKNEILITRDKIQNYFSFLLILSGGLSNIIDRLRFGCVVDFIDLTYWPIFNLADVFIVSGVIIILISMLKKKVI